MRSIIHKLLPKTKRGKRILLAVLIVVFVFELAIHPIIGTILIGGLEHTGAELYESGRYLRFPKGKLFKEHLDSLGFVDDCEVSDFYFINNWPQDNLIYGRACDVYRLDILPNDDYSRLKEQLHSTDCEKWESNDTVFVKWNKPVWHSPHAFLVLTNDDTHQISCILITDLIFYWDYYDHDYERLIDKTGDAGEKTGEVEFYAQKELAIVSLCFHDPSVHGAMDSLP